MDARDLTVELIAHNTVSYNSNVEVMKFLRQRMLEIDCQVEWVEYVDPDGVQKVNLIGKKAGTTIRETAVSHCLVILIRCPPSAGNRVRSRLELRVQKSMAAEAAT